MIHYNGFCCVIKRLVQSRKMGYTISILCFLSLFQLTEQVSRLIHIFRRRLTALVIGGR